MDSTSFLDSLGKLRVQPRGERAPHKPLLLLWAFGRVARGVESRLASYGDEIEPDLLDLLQQFGSPRKTHSPQDPFWRLQHDGLWEIPEQASVPLVRRGRPRVGAALRKTRGGLPKALHELLRNDPELVRTGAQRLLDAHFPTTMHDEIRIRLGLLPPTLVRDAPTRSPHFRDEVLTAYERRCAVCEFDIRIKDSAPLGLEAAHIKWHSHGGPDEVPNGVALCSFHHKALDKGAIGLEPHGDDVVVLVSNQVSGTSQAFDQQLLSFSGRPLRRPHARSLAPAPDYLAWHRAEVFRGSPREARL